MTRRIRSHSPSLCQTPGTIRTHFAALVAMLMAVSPWLSTPAAADHLSGGQYTGTVAGGGTVAFSVSSDGNMLLEFSFEKIEARNCAGTIISGSYKNTANQNGIARIENHRGSYRHPDGDAIDMTFEPGGRASGQLTVVSTNRNLQCMASSLTWSATASGAPAAQQSPPAGAPAATDARPHCGPGEVPQFRFGFATLKQTLGDVMGQPIECEHTDPATGDSLMTTTTGLSFYRRATNTPTFTDGHRHWAITVDGLVYWEGSSVDPPVAAGAAAPPAASTTAPPAPVGPPPSSAAPAAPPAATTAPASVATVSGVVVVSRPSGAPVRVPSARVTLSRVTGGTPPTAEVGEVGVSDGEFAFNGVPSDRYLLTVSVMWATASDVRCPTNSFLARTRDGYLTSFRTDGSGRILQTVVSDEFAMSGSPRIFTIDLAC